MYTYCHEIASLDTRYPDWLLSRLNAASVTGLALVNYELLQVARMPSLYESGVRYRRDPPGYERWKDAVQTLRLGAGDCKDLVAWRLAELWLHGGNAWVLSEVQRGPFDTLFHVYIGFPGGTEDPSRRLGMP